MKTCSILCAGLSMACLSHTAHAASIGWQGVRDGQGVSAALATGFNDLTYTWTSLGAGDPLIGQPSSIRMGFIYAQANGGWPQAQFDGIRFSHAP